MNPLMVLRIALRALGANPLRSFLTVLGVVIGVAAVVAMVAIGEGAKAQVEASFASMGTDMLILTSGSSRSGGMRGGAGTQPSLTWDDLEAIQTQATGVRAATVDLRASATVASEDQNWQTQIHGTGPEFFSIRNWPVELGQPIGPADVAMAAKVAVLGRTVVTELYGEGADPVGKTLRIRNVPFVIAGVLGTKGQSAFGQDYDDVVYVPYTAFQGKIQGGLSKYVTGQMMVAAAGGDTKRAQAQVTALLRERHQLAAEEADDFSIRDLAEMANARQEGTQTMSLLLASIAAVSLLVGGIGIMNIMLVSVTERTREIGLRMAIGAKPEHVLAQFLVEAVALSVAGGLLGVALGCGVAWYVAANFGWSVAIRPDVVLMAVGFSLLVGVGFGLYPAQKASRLEPIDALRAE
jgi:putative ABC transport system permease protein